MLIKDQKKFSTSKAVKSFVNKIIKGKISIIFFSSFIIINKEYYNEIQIFSYQEIYLIKHNGLYISFSIKLLF